MSKHSGSGIGAWLLVAVALVPVVVLTILLGPGRAARIAGSAVLATAVDPLAEHPGEHRIPVLDIHVDAAHLDSLSADLPWSGGRNVPAELHLHGIRYKARFRYRGAVTPSHYLGGKKSFRLALKSPPPQLPFRRINLMNPKSFNMLNNHMALWIGGFMGVAVPHDELVFVRLNGRDHGVMELLEQPDARFERVRGVHDRGVAVFKGDYGPLQGRGTGAIRTLWADAAHWEQVGRADSARARERLAELVAVVAEADMPMAARRDALERLIDVDAWLRYIAALQVVNSAHIDQTHNQVLVLSPRTGRFYPVLWDPLLMYAQPGDPLYYAHDALAYWLLQVPEWRLAKDRHVYQALQVLHQKQLFALHWRSTEERMLPSLLADRNKYGNVSLAPEDVHRFSVVHALRSGRHMRAALADHWERLEGRLMSTSVEVARTADGLQLRSSTSVPWRLSWPAEQGVFPVLHDEDPLTVEEHGATMSVVVYPGVEHAGPRDDPFAERGHFRTLPLEATLRFPKGMPEELVITNAITDEAVR